MDLSFSPGCCGTSGGGGGGSGRGGRTMRMSEVEINGGFFS